MWPASGDWYNGCGVGGNVMMSVDIVKAIGGLLWTGMGIVFVLFVNFLIRRSNPDGVFGIPLPGQWVHAAFGPILVAVNGALLVFFCA